MKRILLTLLTIISIFIITSCGKKKVLTKRSLSDIKDDFTINGENIFDAYCKKEKDTTNEFRLYSSSSSYSKLYITSKYKTKIEKISYTFYNTSDTESFFIYEYKDDMVYKQEGNNAKTGKKMYLYMYPTGDLNRMNIIEIKPNEELNVSIEFSDFEYKTNIGLRFSYYTTDYDHVSSMKTIADYGGIYNLNIEYSIYM